MSTRHGPYSSLFVIFLLSLFQVINGETGYGEQLFGSFRLRQYGSYGDVTLFHVVIPPHCTRAMWDVVVLKIREECPKTEVNIAIQAGSLPLPNPYNTSFPLHTNTQSRRNLNLITMMSNQPVRFTVGTPSAGGWYMASFLPKSKDNKIEQQGLGSEPCYYYMQMGVSYWQEQDVQSLSTHSRTTVQLSSETNETTAFYRFYVSPLTKTLTFSYQDCQVGSEVNGTEVNETCPVEFRARANGLPNVRYSPPVLCDFNASCSLQIGEPLADTWYYVRIDLLSLDGPSMVNLSFGVAEQKCSEENVQFHSVSHENMNFQTLLVSPNSSLTYSQWNSSDNPSASLHPASDESDPELDPYYPPETLASLPPSDYLPMTSQNPFVSPAWCPPIVPLSSVQYGGANPFKRFIQNTPIMPNTTDGVMVPPEVPVIASFELDLLQDIGGNLVIKANINENMEYEEQASITLCLRRGAIPPLNGTQISCDPNYSVTFTKETALFTFPWIVPFPAPGVWYLSLESQCKSNASKLEPCIDTTYVGLDIGMFGCIDGCGEYGKCHSSIDMGIIYYYCACKRGYRGWACTDDSEAWSQAYFLSRLLLLTLSNTFFIFPCLLALKRRHFVPAIAYFCTLIFSSFYHSCDSGSLCIMSFNTLQFCDFFAAFMAIFLTLITMAKLPAPLKQSLEILGAFGMALGTTYNRFSLWAAAVPVGVGLTVLLISWSRRWYKRRRCYPTTKWRWLLFILPGAAVIITGLCLFAFLETSDNYQYVHSAWHVAMAIGVLFLLPPRESNDKQHYTHMSELVDINTLNSELVMHDDPGY
ncbi:transmembrane protein 8B-like [Patiria miniata]|uniref:EGF-like domain-containing protein n=1 Tax=Patiria miniata TaxID=46514 RepID=A0A913ZCT7_PATMI|nr:transmembrane protein 8B-like [Patiria miniata]